MDVVIYKGLGITLRGETGPPVVSALDPNGPFAGHLIVGDEILSVNGTAINDHMHGNVLLDAASGEVVMSVSRVNAASARWVYNDRSYDNDDGRMDGRGWTIFEQGVALTSAAHLSRAKKQGGLPERFAKAESARPKLIDISGEEPVTRDADVEDTNPTTVLENAISAALASSWMGNKDKVREMLYEFEWLIATAIKSASVDALSITTDPRIRGLSVTIVKPLIREGQPELGVTLEGDRGPPVVSAVAPDGLAAGELAVGDVLLSVNGTSIRNHAHGTRLLNAAHGEVALVVRRQGTVQPSAPDDEHSTLHVHPAESPPRPLTRPESSNTLHALPAEITPTQLKRPASFKSRATKFNTSLRTLVSPSRLPAPATASAIPDDVQKSRRSHKQDDGTGAGTGTGGESSRDAPPALLRRSVAAQGQKDACAQPVSASTSSGGWHGISDLEA